MQGQVIQVKAGVQRTLLCCGRAIHGQYQGQYLRDAMDKVINEEHNVEELWTAGGLQITVYHTEDGRLNDWLSLNFIR